MIMAIYKKTAIKGVYIYDKKVYKSIFMNNWFGSERPRCVVYVGDGMCRFFFDKFEEAKEKQDSILKDLNNELNWIKL